MSAFEPLPSFDFREVEHLTFGTVGLPGQRAFYFQVRAAGALVTLKIEKQQVGALSEYLLELMADLSDTGPIPEDRELEEPFDSAWTAGSLGVTYDEVTDRIIIVAEPFVPDADDDAPPLAQARFYITREQATALAARGSDLVEAGRPPCPLCGHPLDPRGHACPRTNGNQPPLP
ncbi:MAG TPA: DUF3090 family protein [Acidimicrobiales bacterium]|nr:DUF3090 family protein [Acidimicrobiales bacterium]